MTSNGIGGHQPEASSPRAKPFSHFGALRAILSPSHELPALHRLVLVTLLRFMDKAGRTFVSQATIAEAAGCSVRAILNVLDDLRKGEVTRNGKRDQLELPFRLTARPKVFKPGERRGEGRPPLEYALEFSAPGAENLTPENHAPVAENSTAFPAPHAANSAAEFSAPYDRVSCTGGAEFHAPGADDLPRSAFHQQIPVAPDGAPPLKLVPPMVGKKGKAKPSKSSATDTTPAPSAHRELLETYRAEFHRERGKYPVITARTGKAAKNLLELMPLEEAKTVVRRAFEDKFFCEKLGELHQIAAAPNSYRGVARTGQVQRSSEEHGVGLETQWRARSDQKKREREAANESVR